ncbi:MAG TPA: ATP-binding protein [Steroidobacteraceae bacterium]
MAQLSPANDVARRWSLRRRLLLTLLVMTVGLWTASAVLFYFEALAEGRKLFDRSLSESATLLLRLAEHEIEEHGPSIAIELLRTETHPAPEELRFQVWTPQLRAMAESGQLAERPFMPVDAVGFGWTRVQGERWRTYAAWNTGHTVGVQIAEPLTRRRELSTWTYVHLIVLATLLLPVSLLGIGWILKRSFAPLRRSASAVAQRSADDLNPVGLDDAPEEVTPLLVALDRLLGRVREALQRERRFTADAAHELRSPLAAIRANAQIMLGARNPQETAEITTNLLASVDRGSRLIDQLLLLARIDSGNYAQSQRARVNLDELLRAECAYEAPSAAQRQITISLASEPISIEGEPGLLAALVRNLLDNAIRYSPPGSRVEVQCRRDGAHAELVVSDNGPGIPSSEREHVFERFYRVVGNESTGSGLGLSIVRSIAELHGGTVEIRDRPTGTGVSFVVRLPGVAFARDGGCER